MTQPLDPENTDKKKKIITYSLAGLGAVLTLAGGITLATQNGNTETNPSTETTQQTTTQTHEENTHGTQPETNIEENPDTPDTNQEENNMQQQNNPNNQQRLQENINTAPDLQDFTQEEKDSLNALFELGNNAEDVDDYSTLAENAKQKNTFGTQINVNGVEITVSNPRTQNNQLTVDVAANNTTDQVQGFSGILFGAGNNPDNYVGPTTESMVALNTEPLAPHQKLKGTLTFDVPNGNVFYIDLYNVETYLWQ